MFASTRLKETRAMTRPIPQQATSRRADAAADPTTWTNVLAEVPLLAGLSRRHLRKVAGTGRIVRFHNATAIVTAGEPGDAFYVIIDGEVSVRRGGVTALSLGTGSFFGEMALLDGGARTATVMAKGPVTCLAITRARFLKLLRDEPTIAIALLGEVAGRLRTLQASL
jgi:CRP/FNR family transcriptional regulator, cyclic AMP receptor protein